MMDLYTTAAAPEINSIRLFWRTYDHRGRLPVRRQGWCYTIIFKSGEQQTAKIPQDLAEQCECTGDAIVLLAEKNGLVISRDQVTDWWPEKCASWNTGA